MLSFPWTGGNGSRRSTPSSSSRQYRHRMAAVPSLVLAGAASGGQSSSSPFFHWLLLSLVAAASFFAGTLWTVQAVGLDTKCLKASSASGVVPGPQRAQLEALVEQRVTELKAKLPKCVMDDAENESGEIYQNIEQNQEHESSGFAAAARKMLSKAAAGLSSSSPYFPSSVQSFAVDMARVSKKDFTSKFELGVPLDPIYSGAEDILMLYGSHDAKPTSVSISSANKPIPVDQAVENCDGVNVILMAHHQKKRQCTALIPQYESYHIQKWMRVSVTENKRNKDDPKLGPLDATYPLRMVSRSYQSNGRDQFGPPVSMQIRQHWDLMATYLQRFDDALKELKPLVEKVATRDKIVTVMVCNFGQSELLVNFVCAAKRRQIDISSVLVFATDEKTKQLAEGMGLTAYYDEENFGDIPSEAAGQYGDRKFTAMMMAKVICVQMVNWLGYDVLFQDVDIVYYKDPLQYFRTTPSRFDMYFQDDGARSARYAPYSANSGFYYVRYNDRTKWFFTSLLEQGPVILKTKSHQQALIALLDEYVSLFGMTVKVLSREDDEFPGGYQYHQMSGRYMKRLFRGDADPYLFHMSWTKNKDNKLLFLRQMGEWYVHDSCIQSESTESLSVQACCAAEPLLSCHYIDKPSKNRCPDDTPRIDPAKHSTFW